MVFLETFFFLQMSVAFFFLPPPDKAWKHLLGRSDVREREFYFDVVLFLLSLSRLDGRGCVFIAESTVVDSKLAQILFSSRVISVGFDIEELSTDGKERDTEVGHTFLAGRPGDVRRVMLIDAPA